MKIAVNTRLLIRNKLDGIGWFTYESLKRMVNQHAEHEFLFVFDRPFDKSFIFSENVTPIVTPPPARHPFLWYWWFEHSLPGVFQKYQPDLFFSPDGYLSLKTNTPTVAVIHDINFEHYPEQLPWLVRRYYRHYFPQFARRADRLITVSEYSRSDIASTYKVSESKIDVVYNGVAEPFFESPEMDADAIKNEYTSGKDFFLVLGTIHPRKNIERILKAFDEFKSARASDVQLLFVGKKMWWTSEMENALKEMKHKTSVRFLGRLDPQKKMIALLKATMLMIYVPVFEGFGMPVIEAQAAAVPVLASNTSSLPEITNDSTELCDPHDVASIAEKMKKLFGDGSLRAQYVELGRRNARRFNWQSTADGIWNVLTQIQAPHAE